MSIESLNECIENGKCNATLFKLNDCIYCKEMKEKLDILGIDYEEREIDEFVLDEFKRKTVPFLKISKESDDDIIFENEDIDSLRRKLENFDVFADES